MDTLPTRIAAVRRVLASPPARRLTPSVFELDLLRDYALGLVSRARANRQPRAQGLMLRLSRPA